MALRVSHRPYPCGHGRGPRPQLRLQSRQQPRTPARGACWVTAASGHRRRSRARLPSSLRRTPELRALLIATTGDVCPEFDVTDHRKAVRPDQFALF